MKQLKVDNDRLLGMEVIWERKVMENNDYVEELKLQIGEYRHDDYHLDLHNQIEKLQNELQNGKIWEDDLKTQLQVIIFDKIGICNCKNRIRNRNRSKY